MPNITKIIRPAYYAPTRNRHYATASAAAWAEAGAQIFRKYPFDDRQFGDEERLAIVRCRLARFIHRAFKRTPH